MTRLSGFLPVLALAASASPLLPAAAAHDKNQIVVPAESLVRVVVEQEASAFVLGDDHQTRQKIQERVSFDGFVLDSKGHVVLFVGEYRLYLKASNVRFTVRTQVGKDYQAQPVGLDDRISVAIVRAPIPEPHPLELASNPSFKHFNVASPGESGCPPAIACLLAASSECWLPFSVLKVSGLGTWAKRCRAQGTLALDPKGKLVGFVTDASPHRYNDKLAYTSILPSVLIASSAHAIVSRGESIPGGWLGIYLADDTQPTVEWVTPKSPAERAGLRARDVILGLDGHKVRSKLDLIHGVRFKGADQNIILDIRRGKADERVELATGNRDPRYAAAWAIDLEPDAPNYTARGDQLRAEKLGWNPLMDLGLIVHLVTQASVVPFPFQATGGLLVKSIQRESRAARAGFRTGDILLRINEISVNTFENLGESIKQSQDGRLRIVFLRGGKLKTSELRIQP